MADEPTLSDQLAECADYASYLANRVTLADAERDAAVAERDRLREAIERHRSVNTDTAGAGVHGDDSDHDLWAVLDA